MRSRGWGWLCSTAQHISLLWGYGYLIYRRLNTHTHTHSLYLNPKPDLNRDLQYAIHSDRYTVYKEFVWLHMYGGAVLCSTSVGTELNSHVEEFARVKNPAFWTVLFICTVALLNSVMVHNFHWNHYVGGATYVLLKIKIAVHIRELTSPIILMSLWHDLERKGWSTCNETVSMRMCLVTWLYSQPHPVQAGTERGLIDLKSSKLLEDRRHACTYDQWRQLAEACIHDLFEYNYVGWHAVFMGI